MSKEAIICVDDEAIILLSLIQELKTSFGNSFLYEKALNADEALEIIRHLVKEGIKIILIITDWLMPGMKGDELLEIIKEEYPGIKAILITGQADQNAINKVIEKGLVLDVLKKPWNPSALKNLISGIISI